jgi:hypothetical protein
VSCIRCTGLTGADVEIADWEEKGSLFNTLRLFFSDLFLECGDHSRPGFRIMKAEASFRRLVTCYALS